MDCDLCEHARRHGWWGDSAVTHCSECHRTWRGRAEAHCAQCHQHFARDSVAILHIKPGGGCWSRQTMIRRGLRLVDSGHGKLWRGKAPVTDWSRIYSDV